MDTKQEPRASVIKNRLDDHFLNTIKVGVATPEPAWWWERSELFGSLAILGWAWPFPNPDFETGESDIPIIVPYCPEIIDDQCQDMDDELLERYLDMMIYVLDLHIGEWDVFLGSERHVTVDQQLSIASKDSHDLLHEMLALAALRYE